MKRETKIYENLILMLFTVKYISWNLQKQHEHDLIFIKNFLFRIQKLLNSVNFSQKFHSNAQKYFFFIHATIEKIKILPDENFSVCTRNSSKIHFIHNITVNLFN